MKARKNMDTRVKRFVAMDHLAARILIYERRKVVHLVENGVLTEADEEEVSLKRKCEPNEERSDD